MAVATTLLCLSSGIRPRYREDVLRASAMPRGSLLRFRYEEDLVPSHLRQKLKANALVGQSVLIAYLARYDGLAVPSAVPIRAAKLRASKVEGQIVILDFELEGIRVADNLEAFNEAVQKEANFPRWEKKLVGSFCMEVDKALAYLKPRAEIEEWRELVTTLKSHKDFDDIPFFYLVTGIYALGEENAIQPQIGVWTVKGSQSYEVRLFQFVPGSDEKGSIKVGDVDWLIAENNDKNVVFLSTSRLAIDSPYDEKTLRFRTVFSSTTQHALISFQRISKEESLQREDSKKPPKLADAVWQFEMPFVISPRRSTLIWQGAVVGALLAAQGLVPIWSNAQIIDKALPSVIAVAIGLLTGLVASFGLRKP